MIARRLIRAFGTGPDGRFDRAHLYARNRVWRRSPADVIVAVGCAAVSAIVFALAAFAIVATIAAALS